MSAVVNAINKKIDNWASFFRIASSFLKRKNPFVSFVANTINNVQMFLNSRKQLKMLKYRVKLMNYRIYQMEQLIQQNNPNNFKGGQNLNQLR